MANVVVGARVVHSMGHVGVVKKVDGLVAVVQFVNERNTVWISDLEVIRSPKEVSK